MSNEATYIGHKGYTIYKNCLELEDQKFIRKSLTVRPHIPKSPVQPPEFPIYRENSNKIYVPKYFGIEHFGEPDDYKNSNGDDINVVFKATLRDYQVKIVDEYLKKTTNSYGGGGLLDIPCGFGKTAMGLNIISRLKKKTLVIVHKGFLLNQWIDRIEEFLPGARVGTIQGQIIDIDEKDIVIGMLQSLSMKDYPDDIFSSFGLTIVDECHHISSEVFSRSLSKIVTRYTLGLSATMDRKDGLSHVFKMFLGEVAYKMERDTEDKVLVKCIEYVSDDKDFEEVVYDYRGNPQYSYMITKICDYNHRTEFIIRVLVDELKENPDQQIMILGQNKSILKYIYDAIEHRNISTVGYYVGGMKEVALKSSETKTVVVATYAMAAEGLDIKTLRTLFLVTPRTDITQAVGRILRVKHDRPMVVDFVDTHQMFKNQQKKRLTFYRKNNYTIMETNSKRYLQDEWDNISTRRGKKSTKNSKPETPRKCLVNL